MKWGYTVDRGEFIPRLICRVTNGYFSHAFPIFYPDDAPPFYFESVWKKDAVTGKNGIRGPLPLSKVHVWIAEDHRHAFALQPADPNQYLPFTPEEVQRAHKMAQAAVGTVRYASAQILRNLITQRLGIRISSAWGSPNRWTCSEFCVRLIPGWAAKFFGWPNLTTDDIPPSGDRFISLWTGTEDLLNVVEKGSQYYG